jgi:hypothetical protein
MNPVQIADSEKETTINVKLNQIILRPMGCILSRIRNAIMIAAATRIAHVI